MARGLCWEHVFLSWVLGIESNTWNLLSNPELHAPSGSVLTFLGTEQCRGTLLVLDSQTGVFKEPYLL